MKKIILLLVGVVSMFHITAQDQNSKNATWDTYMHPKDATFEEIQASFNAYWKDREYKKGKGYKQYKRWENYVKPRIYPSNDLTLPSTTYHNYLDWKKKNSVVNRSVSSNWSELGPFTKATGADTGVGRLTMVRFHPTNPSTIFVGAPDGGLWKSTNSGSSWTTNTDFLGVIGVSDLVIDPNNTNIMYLATGDIEGDRRSIGVLKSTDGGTTWNTTGLTWTAIDNYKISKLLMDPTNSNILLASTDGGVFKTTDAGATWAYPSTVEDFKDMKFKPKAPDTVYAAGREFWRSTDKGSTWTKITSGLPVKDSVSRIAIGVSKADSSYVYVILGSKRTNGYFGLYRSTDSGASFSLRSSSPNVLGYNTTGSDTGGQSNYDLAIAVAPTDRNFVTVGGVNMWQSADGGANWYLICYWDPDPSHQFVHADIHEITYPPNSTNTFYACNDGGLSITTDDGATWTDISNNLAISQQYAMGHSATVEGQLVSGLQDIGSVYKNGTWKVAAGGDGGDCFIDRTNNNNIVVSITYGEHQLSTDGGVSFNNIVTGLPFGQDTAEFFSAIIQDPVSATRFYAGGRPNLYVSNNLGTSWSSTGAPPFGVGKNIIRLAVAPSNNSTIYVLKHDAIAKSTNSGSTWTNITGSLPVASASLTNLTISKTDNNKVWVTFSGYQAGEKVYKTTDGGSTWTNVSSGLPNLPANTIIYDPGSTKEDVYVGMDIGVYQIDNTLSSWNPFSTNLPNVSIRDLEIFIPSGAKSINTGRLRASTYGRGMWETPLLGTVPVELSHFSGFHKNNANVLDWTTLSESNIQSFKIERSANGIDFRDIGSVVATESNSTVTKEYQYLDYNYLNGLNYYRLKVVDLDGSIEYSQTIVIASENPRDVISIYPNPTSNIIQLSGKSNIKSVNLLDVNGRLVYVFKTENLNKLDVSWLPNGVYYLGILDENDKIEVKEFIKN